jgi:hypothetical protein
VTDARLRDAQRRFHDTGSLDDEARLLRERMRTGELPRRHVELAARFGDDAAGLAIPDLTRVAMPTADPRRRYDRGAWMAALLLRHPRGLLRFTVGVLHHGFGPTLVGLDLVERAAVDPPGSRWERLARDDGARWGCRDLWQLHAQACDGEVATWTVSSVLADALPRDEDLRRGTDGARREVSDWLLLRHDALLDRVTAPRLA